MCSKNILSNNFLARNISKPMIFVPSLTKCISSNGWLLITEKSFNPRKFFYIGSYSLVIALPKKNSDSRLLLIIRKRAIRLKNYRNKTFYLKETPDNCTKCHLNRAANKRNVIWADGFQLNTYYHFLSCIVLRCYALLTIKNFISSHLH